MMSGIEDRKEDQDQNAYDRDIPDPMHESLEGLLLRRDVHFALLVFRHFSESPRWSRDCLSQSNARVTPRHVRFVPQTANQGKGP